MFGHDDEEAMPCSVIGSERNSLGLPSRQRVVVRIIFWNADVRPYMLWIFVHGGGIEIDPNTYEIDV